MADVTSSITAYTALVMPHPVLKSYSSLIEDDSTFTEASPRPGVPVATSPSELVLNAGGSQSSGGKIRLQGLTPGDPGPSEAGVAWRNDSSPAEEWRGRNVPSVITYAETWIDAGGAGVPAIDNPHAIVLPDETVLCAHQQTTVGPDYGVSVSKRAPDGTITTTTGILSNGATVWGIYVPYPCLTLLPSGRVLLFCWVQQGTATTANIRMFYSDDSGTTWAMGARYALEEGIDVSGAPGGGVAGYALARLRPALLGSEVCLVGQLTAHDTNNVSREVLAQWRSITLGSTFKLVGSIWSGTDTTEQGAFPELFEHQGRLYLYYHRPSGLGLEGPTWRAIGSTAESFSSATATTAFITGGFDSGFFEYTATGPNNIVATDGDLVVVPDRDGTIYVYARRANLLSYFLKNDWIVICTHDAGASWRRLGTSDGLDGHIWDNSTATSHPTTASGVAVQGRILLLCKHASAGTAYDNSLNAIYLGGASSVTMPNLNGALIDTNQSTWQETYLPLDLPAALANWTVTGAGTEAISAGALSITCALQTLYYSFLIGGTTPPASTMAEGFILRFRMTRSSGGTAAGDAIAVQIQLADGVDDFFVSVRWDSSGALVLYDNHATATVGSAQSNGNDVEVIVALAGVGAGVAGHCALFWRTPSAGSDQLWTVGQSTTTLTSNTGAPAANNLIRFGSHVNTNAVYTWHSMMICYGSNAASHTGLQLASGQDNPEGLYPLRVGTDPVYLDDGLLIRGTDGPLFIGETFSIDARADYELRRAWPSIKRSPREPYRSIDDTAEVTIALAMDPEIGNVAGADAFPGSDVIAVTIVGANFRTWHLEGDPGGSGYVNLATVDNAEGHTGLNFVRKGATIYPNLAGASTDTPYLFRGYHEGDTFDLTGGTLRKISSTTGGVWTNASARNPTIQLSGVDDGADPATATTGSIWRSSVTLLFMLRGRRYASYRIRIPVQSTADGDFRIGILHCGPLFVLGRRPAIGIAETVQTFTEIRESEDLTQTARNLAPGRRVIELPLTDLQYSGPVRKDTPSGWDFFTASTGSSAQPVAMQNDTPDDVSGALKQLAGGRDPVVYLPYVEIDSSGSDVLVLNRAPLMVYGSISSSELRFEQVAGLPWKDYLQRGGGVLAITEIP